MKIGILSDTHGFVHRALIEAFSGVDCILHAGDVGSKSVIDQLRAIAPVHAVRGNIDGGELYELGKILRLDLDGARIAMTHNAGDLIRPAFDLQTRILSQPCDILISGHYHAYWCSPLSSAAGKVLWLSPGAAGNAGHHRERMALLLTILPRDRRSGALAQNLKLETVKFGLRGEP